jgi:hypothetical protein
MDVYVESGPKKVFACAVDWPGWCRSAKTPDAALEALAAYGERYRAALESGLGFVPPAGASALHVVERLKGDSGTDFGIPSAEAKADRRAVDDDELQRLSGILSAAWRTFDATAATAAGHELEKGPRGGGRDLDKIVEHVFEAEVAYARQLGVPTRDAEARGLKPDARMAAVRTLELDLLAVRARGGDPPENPRRRSPYWSPRYFVRRSAWHALDHAWEIEDRVD